MAMKKSVRRILLVILGLALAAELLPIEDALCVYDYSHYTINRLEITSQVEEVSQDPDSLYHFEIPNLALSWTLDEGVMDTEDGYELVIEEFEQGMSLGKFIPFYKPIAFTSMVRVSFSEIIDVGSEKVKVDLAGTYSIGGDLTAYGLVAVRSIDNIIELSLIRNLHEKVEWMIREELSRFEKK